MRGYKIRQLSIIYPLSPTLSRRERELPGPSRCAHKTGIKERELTGPSRSTHKTGKEEWELVGQHDVQ